MLSDISGAEPVSTPLPPSPDPVLAQDMEGESKDVEEYALESHEVIELQLFSERKAWIEEKIEVVSTRELGILTHFYMQLLQNLPPVDVFAGLDAVRSSAEVIPELPARAQLEQWLVEHDAIERETDILDSGELQKLRKFTKGQLLLLIWFVVNNGQLVQRRLSETYLRRTLT